MTAPSSWVQDVLVGDVVQVVSVQVMIALVTWPGVGVLPPQPGAKAKSKTEIRMAKESKLDSLFMCVLLMWSGRQPTPSHRVISKKKSRGS
jgi:hypothetical protein